MNSDQGLDELQAALEQGQLSPAEFAAKKAALLGAAAKGAVFGALDPATPWLQPGAEIGPKDYRFRIVHFLGSDGLSQRFLARDLVGEILIERDCYKILLVAHPHLAEVDPEFGRDFQAAAAKVRALRHPHLARIFRGYTDAPPWYFFTAEPRGGETLARRWQGRQRLPFLWSSARTFLRPLAEALDYAHGEGVVHGDVRQEHVLFPTGGGVQLTHTGFIPPLDQGARHSANLGQLPPPEAQLYWAPERQVPPPKGIPPDPRQDVHALACLIWELLVGSPPFGPAEAPGRQPNALPSKPNTLTEPAYQLLCDGFAFAADQRPQRALVLFTELDDALRRRSQPNTRVAAAPSPSMIHGWTAEAVQRLQQDTASVVQRPLVFRDTTGVGHEGPAMVVIPPGAFLMGSPASEAGHQPNETQHRVQLSQPFALGRFAVTVEEFRHFVQAADYRTEAERGDGALGWTGHEFQRRETFNWRQPGFLQADDHPVTCISWHDAEAYIHWLAQQTGQPYRLPTEAEWEYACRAGTTTPFHWGNAITTAQANYNGTHPYAKGKTGLYRQQTLPVDEFTPNPFGLYQMHGNVWEWCADGYVDDPAAKGARIDPLEQAHGLGRVRRGGSWYNAPDNLRSAYRFQADADRRRAFIGVRVARSL
ncbi:MAG: SUMF1/EgtB/PvdO family nonheme iron enzyme [Candidatus Competibacterales bacterium]